MIAWSVVVFSAEFCSYLGRLEPLPLLLCHAAFALAAWLAWRRAGAPPLVSRPFRKPSPFQWRESVRRHPALWLLGATVAGVALVNAGLILYVPPNNYDSMTYHLSRVAYWMQHGSFAHWQTANFRQTMFPPNAEIGALASMIFLRSDLLAGFVQYTAAIAAGIAIFGLARYAGHARPAAAFAALLWATLPPIVLQSTSTQNDLVVTSFLVAAAFLLVVAAREEDDAPALVSGLAIGLALGTKVTALLAAPGLVLSAVLLTLRERTSVKRVALLWPLACVVGFLLLGSHNYVRNWRLYGHPLGSAAFRLEQRGGREAPLLRVFAANAARDAASIVDPAGLPSFIDLRLVRLRGAITQRVFENLGFQPSDPRLTWPGVTFQHAPSPAIHEDRTWFGPLGFLVWTPALAWAFWQGARRRNTIALLCALTALSVAGGLCAAQLWHPWRSRFYVLAFTFAAPLVAAFWREERLWRVLRWGVVLLACGVAVKSATRNRSKPLIGASSVLLMTRDQRWASWAGEALPMRKSMESMIPENARVALMVGGDAWDYPVFGPHLSRRVVPIVPPPDRFDEWIKTCDYDYAVVRFVKPEDNPDTTPTSDWYIFVRDPSKTAPAGKRRAPAPPEFPVAPETGARVLSGPSASQ